MLRYRKTRIGYNIFTGGVPRLYILLTGIGHCLEVSLGRVINTEGSGQERTRLTKAVVLAIRELMRQTETNEKTYDLAAFIVLALKEIASTIDTSVAAWEKRGYWVKADRFRLEWDWTETLGERMNKALLAEDWPSVAQISIQVAGKLGDIKVSERHRLGTPWVGAWDKLKNPAKSRS